MLAHLGHLVQRPSGMSRLRDLVAPSLGFFANAVSVLLGGGVTPGSTVSSPRVFLLKEVVAIISYRPLYTGWIESTTRHGPDADISRAAVEQNFGAGAGGCASSQDIVDEHNTLTIQARGGKQCKCLSHIFNSLAAREPGLRPRRLYSAQQAAFQRNLGGIA